MILETERLILRGFLETDAESVYEYCSDPDVAPIAGSPLHTSAHESRELIKKELETPEIYSICLKPDTKNIGAVMMMIGEKSNIGLPNDEGEIGFLLNKKYWGQGIAPEATREIVRHAFTQLDLKTLWAGYFEGNERSKRVLEKCGFVYHHTEKDIYWKQTNDIRTEHITKLTKEDWERG